LKTQAKTGIKGGNKIVQNIKAIKMESKVKAQTTSKKSSKVELDGV